MERDSPMHVSPVPFSGPQFTTTPASPSPNPFPPLTTIEEPPALHGIPSEELMSSTRSEPLSRRPSNASSIGRGHRQGLSDEMYLSTSAAGAGAQYTGSLKPVVRRVPSWASISGLSTVSSEGEGSFSISGFGANAASHKQYLDNVMTPLPSPNPSKGSAYFPASSAVPGADSLSRSASLSKSWASGASTTRSPPPAGLASLSRSGSLQQQRKPFKSDSVFSAENDTWDEYGLGAGGPRARKNSVASTASLDLDRPSSAMGFAGGGLSKSTGYYHGHSRPGSQSSILSGESEAPPVRSKTMSFFSTSSSNVPSPPPNLVTQVSTSPPSAALYDRRRQGDTLPPLESVSLQGVQPRSDRPQLHEHASMNTLSSHLSDSPVSSPTATSFTRPVLSLELPSSSPLVSTFSPTTANSSGAPPPSSTLRDQKSTASNARDSWTSSDFRRSMTPPPMSSLASPPHAQPSYSTIHQPFVPVSTSSLSSPFSATTYQPLTALPSAVEPTSEGINWRGKGGRFLRFGSGASSTSTSGVNTPATSYGAFPAAPAAFPTGGDRGGRSSVSNWSLEGVGGESSRGSSVGREPHASREAPKLSSSERTRSQELGGNSPGEPSTPSDGVEVGGTIGSFRVLRVLGRGAFSKVCLGRSVALPELREGEAPPHGEVKALKMIEKQSYEGAEREKERMKISVAREVQVLKYIHHPSLVSLCSSFTTSTHTVLVLDYAPGGELFDFLAEWQQHITEPLARRMFGELANAIGWMHSIGLVHRDIKLENVLLTARPFPTLGSEDVMARLPSPFVKLTDFGLSRFISPASPLLSTRCGSEAYAAPELIMGKRYDGRKTDAWALGVVLFAVATGEMPFVEERERKRKSYLLKIAKGEFKWPPAAIPDAATMDDWSNSKDGASTLSPASPDSIMSVSENGHDRHRSEDSYGGRALNLPPPRQSSATSTGVPLSTTPPPPVAPGPQSHVARPGKLASAPLRAVIERLLTRSPEERASVSQVWDMAWMHGDGEPARKAEKGWVEEKARPAKGEEAVEGGPWRTGPEDE